MVKAALSLKKLIQGAQELTYTGLSPYYPSMETERSPLDGKAALDHGQIIRIGAAATGAPTNT
jgi:hypothetical protein